LAIFCHFLRLFYSGGFTFYKLTVTSRPDKPVPDRAKPRPAGQSLVAPQVLDLLVSLPRPDVGNLPTMA
jgi:hypothetical protein